ncbi:epsin-3 [Arachis duranensis]|uniref:Epsin-3 n=1 Tax=Arachis duranensis TaxID=130453 RepID=A0A6P4BIW4_ARADU|nr:epsin-3 [Arachis duranensis]
MGSVLLEQIKKQTTNFLQEKYKSARITFTDVTEIELLAEETINKDDCSPDAKTMTRIAEASFELDDYWRIVDVLHSKFCTIDWEQWRQSYNALVLLEFLITHGPVEFALEFQRDAEIIEELGRFTYIDERGFNWGARMLKLSEHILKLLEGGEALNEARLKALKITNEIQGYGISSSSPSSSSSSPSSSSWPSSPCSPQGPLPAFRSFSTPTTPTPSFFDNINSKNNNNRKHLWGGANETVVEERNVLIDDDDDDDDGKLEKPKGFVSEICSKIIGDPKVAGFRCLSDVGRKEVKKKYDRQSSLWF